MKAIEQYIHVVSFTMLYKVVLIFQSEDDSNESYCSMPMQFIIRYGGNLFLNFQLTDCSFFCIMVC